MEWCGISGSWRRTNKHVARDVRKAIDWELETGNGIVSGGALGVDYIATQFVLSHGNPQEQLKIFLPTDLETYLTHYSRKAGQGVISHQQAYYLTKQIRTLAEMSPDIISSLNFKRVNKNSYYSRNKKVVDASDYLRAFKVNNSPGVQDTINKAKAQDKKVILKRYKI